MTESYRCSLDEASLKVAIEELNEDPRERESQVKAFRNWINQQKHITACTDTGYLLNFLRTGKFSQLRAREVLEGYLKMKSKYPEWLDDVDTADPEIQRFLGTGYVLPLPRRDAKGRRIIIINPEHFDADPGKWNRDVVVKAIFGLCFYYLMDEKDVVNGWVFFQDFSHFSSRIMTFYGLDTMKKAATLWQGSFPGRFKKFHYYNPGKVFESMMAIFKPLLSKKFQNRIIVHGKNLEDVYNHIPLECLPDEYLPDDYTGPTIGTTQQLIDDFLTTLRTDRVRQHVLRVTNSKWKYNFDAGRHDVTTASFRKLNLD
ncbi:hypothetical protein LSH36_537g01030 [Paralvinella palmiformis]|uniref:CRAL-TRIO domain-containing protein n=1 Tax=Paralvinella palmiformis TaxID=53620 RepID=A0AAD9MYK9_9ANNE|nr:hypothetical protein LSH36_537g01030 [Paralvinella palmiformis]